MSQLVGQLVIATGILDLLVCFWLYPGPLTAIAGDGFVNAVELDPPRLDRETAFWHVTFGMLVVIVGALVRWAQAQTGTLPLFLGWALLSVGLFGAVLMPVSGFWFLLPQAVIALAVARREARPRSHPRATETGGVS